VIDHRTPKKEVATKGTKNTNRAETLTLFFFVSFVSFVVNLQLVFMADWIVGNLSSSSATSAVRN
jgi:hypothetical protein